MKYPIEPIEPIDYKEIGEKIRKQRERLGLTQEQLSEICDLSTSFVGHIERGSRKLSVDSLYRLASALDMSADYLLFDRIQRDSSVPEEISFLLRGCNKKERQQFWRIVKVLARYVDELF